MKIKDFSPEAKRLRYHLKRSQGLLRAFAQGRDKEYPHRLMGHPDKVKWALMHVQKALDNGVVLCEEERADLLRQVGLTRMELQRLRDSATMQNLVERKERVEEAADNGEFVGLMGLLLVLFTPEDLERREMELSLIQLALSNTQDVDLESAILRTT